MTRKLPIISIEDFETKSKKRLMMKSMIDRITEGVELNLESVNIAEIKNQNLILSLPKSEWKPGLKKAIDFYVEKEEYEKCSKIKDLIDQL